MQGDYHCPGPAVHTIPDTGIVQAGMSVVMVPGTGSSPGSGSGLGSSSGLGPGKGHVK